MRFDDCYRLLDVDPRATDEELRRAHLDLTKVWHPDRFGHDLALRRKAEEKLKAINEAYETIRAGRPGQRQEEAEFPEVRTALTRQRRYRTYALTCALIGIFILLRRPTPAGLVIALVLFVVAFVFVARMRRGGPD